MSKENKYHVISNTHWDREWRFPFQRNRQFLVDMIDAVLDILEKEPDYRAFHLDSQSIVLKDYLEIKPQNEERIVKLTKENRLLHGPWYILPEEFQVGGENLIRNLLIGHRVSKRYGGVSKIGYSPFSWGQISQLPQLYKEFGINLIMFYRGINSIDSPKSEFLWVGADGTEMVSSRFSTMPRYNFYFYIYRPVIHNEGFSDVEYKWENGGIPFHFSDNEQHNEDYFIIEHLDGYYPENIEPMVNKIINDQSNDFTTPHKIWMEGHDSSGPNAKTVRIIQDIRKQMPNVDVKHSTLEEYARFLAESVDIQGLTRVTGERRSAQNNNRCGNLFGYTTSARMYLKQANFDAERWIQYYAEPFNVFSGLLGRDINDTYIDTAWELIVQNSAHDSIGGCSLDRIHEDMMIRYKQAIEISKGVFDRSVKHLVKQLNTSNFKRKNTINPSHDIFVNIINTTNYNRNQVVELYLDVPKSLDKGSIEIYNEHGNSIPIQIVNRKPHSHVLEQLIDRPMFFDMVQYHLYAFINDSKPFSLKPYLVKPVAIDIQKTQTEKTYILENDYLKVDVNQDGTLNITDKTSGRTINSTGWFCDEGDAGHAWVHLKVGEAITTLRQDAMVEWVEKGNLVQELRIVHKVNLPLNLESRKGKSEEMALNTLSVYVRLHKNEPFVRFRIEVDNQSESHRLRMIFPLDFLASHSYGEGQFDVVERSTERPDTSLWIEQPMYDFPMHHFVATTDGQKSMAVLVNGLKEYEVLPDNRNLAITLFRSFEYKINPSAPQDYSYEKGSQMLGKSTYELALYPFLGTWLDAKVYPKAFEFNYPLRAVQTGSLHGNQTSEVSFMQVQPEVLTVSSLKKPEDGNSNTIVLRLYNPSNSKVDGTVTFLQNIKSATIISIEEVEKQKLQFRENHLNIETRSKQILTIKVEFK